jgi:hypothetical protein
MPALIRELAVAGSRKSDGSANASGKVFLYEPGTTTLVPGYTDDTLSEAWTTDGGGIPLDAGGRVAIWINDMIDIVVSDADGGTVNTFIGYNKTRAEQVEVENDSFTGTLDDGSQGAGGKTNLDTILTSIGDSLGGVDGLFQESSGATGRTIADKFREIWISVKDFGALGNGVHDDTTAFQEAVSRAIAAGSATVWAPAGTYKTSAVIAATNGTVTIRGAGRGSTIIAPTAGAANAFTFTACPSSGIHDMSILHTGGSTGAAVAVGGASAAFRASGLYIPADGTYAGFAYGLDFSGASDFDEIAYCQINADTVGLRANTTSTTKPALILGCGIGASGLAPVSPTSGIEFNGANGSYTIIGTRAYGATNNILFNAAWAGTTVRIIGGDISTTNGSTPLNMSGLAADRDVRWWGCGVDGYTVNVLSGATVTPDRSQGPHIRIRGTSTGSAYVVAAPTPPPSLGSTRDIDLFLTFYNNAGGAITGWTLDAAYHMAAVSTTNLEMTSYHLKWDADIQVWREFSRSVTT